MTLGLTSLHPHAVVPSLLSDEGKRIVLPAFFQRGRDFPDKTRQTLATAHASVRHTAGDHTEANSPLPEAGRGPGGYAAVNFPKVDLAVVVKDHSENEGMLAAPTEAGVVEPIGRVVVSGSVTVPVCRLVGKVCR